VARPVLPRFLETSRSDGIIPLREFIGEAKKKLYKWAEILLGSGRLFFPQPYKQRCDNLLSGKLRKFRVLPPRFLISRSQEFHDTACRAKRNGPFGCRASE
jgi:hypothetical protein